MKLYLVVTGGGRQYWHRNRASADRTMKYIEGELIKVDMNERRTQELIDFLNEHARWRKPGDE